MKLYDNPLSPYAMKIRGMLYEKGIAFEKHEIHTQSQRRELIRLNGRGEVPALVDGDVVLFDSNVIAEYIEERYPAPPLLPAAPADRARCRALEHLSDTEIDAAVIAYSIFKFFRPGLEAKLPDAARNAESGLRAHFVALDRRLDGRDYFLGSFSRADLAFIPHLGAAAFMGLSPGADTPHLAAWLARMNERDSVQRTTQEALATLEQKHDDPAFDNDRLHWRSDRIEQLLRIGMGPWLLEELAADRAFLPPGA
jgi:glutathione S-transferase